MIVLDIPAEDRAQLHSDGRALLDILEAHDTSATIGMLAGKAADQMLTELGTIDGPTVHTVAILRAVAVIADVSADQFLADPVLAFASMWADGLLAGIEFQSRGGHQKDK